MGMAELDNNKVWTIGHSNHSLERFTELLSSSVPFDFLVDVRTSPVSGYSPHFNKESLKQALELIGIQYIHLPGLGGRPKHDNCYTSDGRVIYNELERTPEYKRDLAALEMNIRKKKCVIMCSCGAPEYCHRNLSIAFVLIKDGFEVLDILPDGQIQKSSPPQIAESLFGAELEEVRKSKLPVRQNTAQENFSH